MTVGKARADADQAGLQESVRLVARCGCPMCVDVVASLAVNGIGWGHISSPCRTRTAGLYSRYGVKP